jgi:hypothetical protein
MCKPPSHKIDRLHTLPHIIAQLKIELEVFYPTTTWVTMKHMKGIVLRKRQNCQVISRKSSKLHILISGVPPASL